LDAYNVWDVDSMFNDISYKVNAVYC
jgi:hypothetical protein